MDCVNNMGEKKRQAIAKDGCSLKKIAGGVLMPKHTPGGCRILSVLKHTKTGIHINGFYLVTFVSMPKLDMYLVKYVI